MESIAVLTEIAGDDLEIRVKVIAGEIYPYPKQLRSHILSYRKPIVFPYRNEIAL